ncbi:MAG: DUF2202 domain-containing protein [gamma proteobacterium symbiont of Taylorina sp.]|nr:DUF2202 domain-containing protein [gamma proteobacterium symbiont of Taylorina sp.]
MIINNKILSLIMISSLALSVPLYAMQGHGQGNNSGTGQGPGSHEEQTNSCQLEPDISSEINQEVESQLQFMGEEEKLARDVYVYLNTVQPHNVFVNIAKAEQIHINSVNRFLEAYDIQNLASDDYGIFTNPELQQLYDDLIAIGSSSLVEALMVGALIEEVDIKDLIISIEQTNDQSMIQMYSNLMSGSYNHLRAFVAQLETQGVTYTNQGVLSQQQVDDILNGENTTIKTNTAQSLNSSGTTTASESCFINKMSKNSKIVTNNTQFSENDTIQLSSKIKVSTQDQGKNAKLTTIISYTSEAGESFLIVRDNLSWKMWDGDIASLSFAEQTILDSEQNLDIITGKLNGLRGNYAVLAGYILEDGSIVYSADLMFFSVQE